MKYKLFFIVSISCFLFAGQGVAQNSKASLSEEEILRIYGEQLSEGYKSRGMSNLEIEKYISKGKVGISTLNDFAKQLPSLFPDKTNEGLAVLFFFFKNDTLFRFFIVPGLVKEVKMIPIKKNELEQLNADMYNALNIFELTKNRGPQKRGLKKKEEPASSTRKISLDVAITNATQVLVPENFSEKYKHIIIVPAFNIGTFPFQLLKPYKDGSFFIDKCSFSIASSLMDIVALRKRLYKNGVPYDKDSISFTLDQALFVSNPSYPANAEYIFPNLPGAKKEIQNAILLAKGYTLLEGKEATKENVLHKMKDADVVYFATHAVASEINPLDNNFLVLSGNSDPFLTSRDIMKLRDTLYTGQNNFPQLVILSACQTGLGQSREAGVTGGLARSFLIAGANQVIMSLWSVNDASTSFLMNRFIFHLQENNMNSPSEVLRLAELDTRKKFPNPVDWASFSMYGVNF